MGQNALGTALWPLWAVVRTGGHSTARLDRAGVSGDAVEGRLLLGQQLGVGESAGYHPPQSTAC